MNSPSNFERLIEVEKSMTNQEALRLEARLLGALSVAVPADIWERCLYTASQDMELEKVA